jgi:hypothetical protein
MLRTAFTSAADRSVKRYDVSMIATVSLLLSTPL